MGKRKYYLTLDTETATLPFANEICKTVAQKQKVAIAKPLVYDIGWVVTDRTGTIYKKKNYLVQETFFVPNVFNTAYYKDKRPIYMELLEKHEIDAAKWDDVIKYLLEDLDSCDLVAAYNACFDFKKAIPFTERYIKNLYSKNYYRWEKKQREICYKLATSNNKADDESKNPEFLEPFFDLRGRSYPIVDLWGVACDRLINVDRYKDYCLQNNLLTKSASYFSTSAETSFQYLAKKHDFVEDHTALSDALIESEILTKALKKGKLLPSKGQLMPKIESFPFQKLGTTFDYVQSKPKYANVVKDALKLYIDANDGVALADGFGTSGQTRYWKKVLKNYAMLEGCDRV